MRLTLTTARLVAVALAAALAACGHSSSNAPLYLHDGSLGMADGEVVISGRDGTAARVAADGRLRIGAAEVSLSDGQRAQFVAYYGAARAVYRHAASTGMAGALLGVTAATGVATGVATGIAKGDLSDLNAKIEAQADEVKREALKICDSLGELRSVQDALAAELPAFTPYAVVSVRETRDCGKDLKKGPGG